MDRNPCDARGNVGGEVPVWVVPAILPSERNGVVNEEANHALLQGVLCGFNACFVDLRGTVNRESREHIHSGKEQCPVSDRKQKVLKRAVDAAWAIVYFWATDRYRLILFVVISARLSKPINRLQTEAARTGASLNNGRELQASWDRSVMIRVPLLVVSLLAQCLVLLVASA